MTGAQPFEVPVLVVGGGPAGLATAITLAGYGVETVLVDRRTEPSTMPRATALSTRSMELCRGWGVADAVLAGAVDVDWRLWTGHTLTSASGELVPVGLPTREQAAVISPIGPACVPQDHVEPVLLGQLRSLPSARVLRGTEMVGLDLDGDDATVAVLRDRGSGVVHRLRARYLVGADGAHSVVRARLNITMTGTGHLGDFLSTVFRAPLWDVLGERRHGIYWVSHPAAAGNFLPAGRGDRWVYGLAWDPGRQRRADFTEDRLVGLIRTGAGVPTLAPKIERVGTFQFAALIARRYRVGDAFLVGDAAHRVSPRGGTGLNTAIGDGHNLGWKLAWVLRGWAEPALLDSYADERRPVGLHNTRRSAEPDGSRRTLEDALPVDLGGRIPHVWVEQAGRRVSTLDLLGQGWTAFTGPWTAAPTATTAPADRAPVTAHRLDAISAAAVGVPAGGTLLVRPDGVPVPPATGQTEPAVAVSADATR